MEPEPEQIRKTKFDHDSAEWEIACWLRETAAQLAQLNQHVEFICGHFAVESLRLKKKARKRNR